MQIHTVLQDFYTPTLKVVTVYLLQYHLCQLCVCLLLDTDQVRLAFGVFCGQKAACCG